MVQDHCFFSCVANMVLLPTPLKTFTDTMPNVKAMLRICARSLYGWQCDHASMTAVNTELDEWHNWDDYPDSWPREEGDASPKGVMAINPDIRKSAERRWKNIQKDLLNAGKFYPRVEVQKALAYWELNPEKPLDEARS